MKADDFIPKDLAATVAKAVEEGIRSGAKRGFSGGDFLQDLKDQMEEIQKDQKATEFNEKVRKIVAGGMLSTKQAELEVLKDQHIETNNSLITEYQRNAAVIERLMLLAEEMGNMSRFYQFQEKLTALQGDIDGLVAQNEQIKDNTKQMQDLLKQQEESNEALEKSAEINQKIANASEWLKKYQEGWENIQDILKTPELAKAVFLDAVIDKLGEAYESFESFRKMGLTAGQAVGAQFKSMDIMSLLGLSDTKGVLQGVVEEYGNINALSKETVSDLGMMAHHFGIAGQEALKVNAALSQMPGETAKTAAHAMEHVGHMAELEGIAPAKIMRDMAEQTETMALYSKGGAEGFGKAAIELHKMGIEIGTAAKMAEGLLDFENSINKQMEASVLLGREINLDKARELSLLGDLEGATKEVLKNVGGAAEFDRMNVMEKKALAEAAGLTVAELQKTIDAQEESNKYFGEGATLGERALGTILEYGGAAAGFLKENGELLLAGTQFILDGNLAKMAGYAADAAFWVKEKAHMLWKFGMQKIMGKGAQSVKDVAGDKTELPKTDTVSDASKKMGGGGMVKEFKKNMQELAEGFKAMGQPDVRSGVINTLIAGPALLIAVPAIPFLLFMGKVDLKSLEQNFTSLATGLKEMGGTFIGSAALVAFAVAGTLAIPSLIFLGGLALIGKGAELGLKALGRGLVALGTPATAVAALIGIGLIAALGVAMIPFAYALSLVTPLVEAFGNIIVGVLASVPPIITAIADGFVTMFTTVSQNIGALLALGPALMMIGTGLSIMSLAGIGALPIIGALAGLAVVAPALTGLGASLGGLFGGGEGEKEDKMDTLIAEIRELKVIASQGGQVSMDGKKVGEVIRLGLNSAGIR